MVRIGTAGWSIPRSAAALFDGEGSHLERYARVLPCAEINSTFYRPPMDATWTKWAAAAPDGFLFSVKAPKTITHEAKLVGAETLLRSFLEGALRLGDRLGPLLFQLPPSLAFEAGVAREFFELVRGEYAGAVALEPRHATWFGGDVTGLLAEFQVARVAADPARVPEAAEPGGWEGLRYYRLHGSPRIYYSAYSASYVERLAAVIASGPDGCDDWVIFDNTASGAAIHDALALRTACATGVEGER